MGLLSFPLTGLAFLALSAASRSELYGGSGPRPVTVLALGVGIALAVAAYVGLLVRHRDQWWVWPVVILALLGVAAWAAGYHGTADVLGPAAGILLAWGVVRAGHLPRRGAIALAVGAAAGPLPRDSLLGAVAVLVGAYGFLVLSWAMWREPLPAAAQVEQTVPGY
jgi:hypothetical protein